MVKCVSLKVVIVVSCGYWNVIEWRIGLNRLEGGRVFIGERLNWVWLDTRECICFCSNFLSLQWYENTVQWLQD